MTAQSFRHIPLNGANTMRTHDNSDRSVSDRGLSVCIVGSGTRFLSGISYYTMRLANTMECSYKVSAILMRQLLPSRFYPGRKRVGKRFTQQEYAPSVKVFNGVDWYWIPTLFHALAFLIRQRPDVVIFQWWTGSVLHTYLVIASAARLMGAKVIIEFHEIQDTGEARLRFAHSYVEAIRPLLIRIADGLVVHSEYDRNILERLGGLRGRQVTKILHGPYDHYVLGGARQHRRTAPVSCCNLLYFGVIRPFKGLEDLITAFNSIPSDQIPKYWLTIVGETWEGWTLPTELIATSIYQDRITFVNRYVCDDEVAEFFAAADAVVLPYHRSSASGPLHIAMSWGLPVVVTTVGGLPEAVADYDGVIFVPPANPEAIRVALEKVLELRGKRFASSQSWQRTLDQFHVLIASLVDGQPEVDDAQAVHERPNFTQSRGEELCLEETVVRTDQD